jgi:flagellin
MGLRINTNINAMYSINNLNNTNNKLSQSLNRLSTGLRITKAADDAAGMTIADGLKFQSTNLGQSISNGNNAIKLIQIADMALQKSIDIVGTIAQKATQAANATEDVDSRAALQADINKYIEELNNISKTTSYKNVNLLDGTFVNKLVHIGAYSDQTLSISAKRTASDSIGWIAHSDGMSTFLGATTETNATTDKLLQLDSTYNMAKFNGEDLTINGTHIADAQFSADKYRQLDAKTAAQAINSVEAQTGVTANAENIVTGSATIDGGTITAGEFLINGVDMGDITVEHADVSDALVNTINQHTDETGVVASKNDQDKLVLTAEDGRNIAIKADTNVTNIIHLSDSETTLTGTAGKHLSHNKVLSFYVNGVHIAYTGAATASMTVASVVKAINAAGFNVSGVTLSYTGTTSTAEQMVLTAVDGRDLNIYMTSDAAAVQNAAQMLGGFASHQGTKSYIAFIDNQSNHGTITLTSQDEIEVAGTNPNVGGLVTGIYTKNTNLDNVDVTNQKGAELSIKIAQQALSDLDKVRSNLGSVQNQIQATVENISVTQINISGAESTIRDVNFAQESSNFSKLQILAQSGTYALAQSNAVQQNILRLLQ